MKIIQDAEREERRLMFEENKDELVAAVSDDVVARIAAHNTELLQTMARQLADDVISRTYLAKPEDQPRRIKPLELKTGS